MQSDSCEMTTGRKSEVRTERRVLAFVVLLERFLKWYLCNSFTSIFRVEALFRRVVSLGELLVFSLSVGNRKFLSAISTKCKWKSKLKVKVLNYLVSGSVATM